MPNVMLLVKVFSESKHVDEFMRGRILARRISYFRQIEERDGRGDEYEGDVLRAADEIIVMPHHPITDRITDAIRIPKQNIGGPVVMRTTAVDHHHLYCMSTVYVGDDEAKEIRRTPTGGVVLTLTRLGEFGDHAVVITNPNRFLERVKLAATLKGFGLEANLVKYYDQQRGTPTEPFEHDAVFHKRDNYAYQREFRVVIDTGTSGTDPLTLDIGALDSMAQWTEIKGGAGLHFLFQPQG